MSIRFMPVQMPRTDPLAEAIESLSLPIAPKDFRVFVFGPALTRSEVVTRPRRPPNSHDAVVEHAKFLRFKTARAIEAENFTVDFGETESILNLWEKNFKTPDPGSAEIQHASRACQAVIIFPSSVGSICELSLFAQREQIAQNTFAIVHNRYRDDKSFFRLGLLELFDQERGRREFLDYADHNRCVQYAVRFVKGRFQKTLRDVSDIDFKLGKYRGTTIESAIKNRPG